MRRTTASLTAASILTAAAAASFGSAAPAHAAGCTPISDGRQYLAAFGDTNTYAIMPGGTFDGGASGGWTGYLAGTTPATNSPFNVTGSSVAGALAVHGSGRATSPSVCVKWQDDRVRFFYKAPAGTSFKVSVTGSSDGYGTTTVNTWLTASTSDWQLSPALLIPDSTDWTGTQLMRMSIANAGTGTVTVDDVLVDPWKATRW